MVVWSEDLAKLLKPGEFYIITNLRNKLFEQQSQLNTTSQTKVVSITPVTNVSDGLTLLQEEKLEANFDSVQITNSEMQHLQKTVRPTRKFENCEMPTLSLQTKMRKGSSEHHNTNKHI